MKRHNTKSTSHKNHEQIKKNFFLILLNREWKDKLRKTICKPTYVTKDSDLDYIINSQNSTLKKASNSVRKRAKGTKDYITEEANEYVKRCSTPLYIAAAAAKSLQSCPTLCDPIDGSPPGSPVPGILQARILEWVAISFFNAWKWKVKVKSLRCVQLFATPGTAAYRAPPTMGFSRQEYWSGVPLPSPSLYIQFSSVAQSCPTLCDPMNRSTPGLPVHHQLPKITQTHVHQIGDAIQASHPLSSSSPPAPNPSQHQGLFQWVNSSHEVAKVLEFQP